MAPTMTASKRPQNDLLHRPLRPQGQPQPEASSRLGNLAQRHKAENKTTTKLPTSQRAESARRSSARSLQEHTALGCWHPGARRWSSSRSLGPKAYSRTRDSSWHCVGWPGFVRVPRSRASAQGAVGPAPLRAACALRGPSGAAGACCAQSLSPFLFARSTRLNSLQGHCLLPKVVVYRCVQRVGGARAPGVTVPCQDGLPARGARHHISPSQLRGHSPTRRVCCGPRQGFGVRRMLTWLSESAGLERAGKTP